MSIWQATWLVFQKDLRIELRTGEILITTGFFALLITIMTSLSFYLDDVMGRKIAPGVLWISIAFSGVLAMGRSFQRERDHEVMRGLLLSPLPRAGIYLGKALGILAFLSLVELLLLPLIALLYRVDFGPALAQVALVTLLGTIGFSAAGALFAAMGVRVRTKELVLSVVLFPLVSPALLAGVVATREVLAGASLGEIVDWLRVLAAFDLIFVVLGAILFGPLTSE
ncbi:MAG: heme exporter protein CcmB [Polyangiales bacterium]